MSEKEYQKKLDSYMRSSAPQETIKKAIENLNIQRNGISRRNNKILSDMYEGMSETRMGEI